MEFKDYKDEHEIIRQMLWFEIAKAYVQSSNSTSIDEASKWADRILQEFDKRFKRPRD